MPIDPMIEGCVKDHRLIAGIESDLIRLAQSPEGTEGRQEARDTLVIHNMRMVLKIAYNYGMAHRVDPSMLVADGIDGLLASIDLFNFDRGSKLITYATWWIRQRINKAIGELNMIRLPNDIQTKRTKFIKGYRKEHHTLPSNSEIVNHLIDIGIPRFAAYATVQSMSTPYSGPAGGANYDDCSQQYVDTVKVSSKQEEDLAENMDKKEDIEQLHAALGKIRPDIAQIIMARYGIGVYLRSHSLDEIGAVIGVSKERIRQLEDVGIRTIRSLHKVEDELVWKASYGNENESFYIERSELIIRELGSKSAPGKAAGARSRSPRPCERIAPGSFTRAKSTHTSTPKRATTTERPETDPDLPGYRKRRRTA